MQGRRDEALPYMVGSEPRGRPGPGVLGTHVSSSATNAAAPPPRRNDGSISADGGTSAAAGAAACAPGPSPPSPSSHRHPRPTSNFQEQFQDQLDNTVKPAIRNFFFPAARHRRRRAVLVADSEDDDDYNNSNNQGRADRGKYPGQSGSGGGSAGGNGMDAGDRSGRSGSDHLSSSSPSEPSSPASASGRQPPPHYGNGGDGSGGESGGGNDGERQQQGKQDRRFVEHFWRTYDDIIILSLFTQLGILFRLGMATYFTFFDSVFSNDSALFENLPLNCLSCFIMGTLCSGERLMEIIATRFTPSRLQHDVVRDADDDDDENENDEIENDDDDEREDGNDGEEDAKAKGRKNRSGASPRSGSGTGSPGGLSPRSHQLSPMRVEGCSSKPRGLRLRRGPATIFSAVTAGRNRAGGGGGRGRGGPGGGGGGVGARRPKRRRTSYFHSWQPPVHLDAELREVQLLALERRIRASKCLLLFPVRKEDFDLMEHYFESGYKRTKQSRIVVDGPASSLDEDEDSEGPERPSSYARNANDLSYDLELQVELEGRGAAAAANEDEDDPLSHYGDATGGPGRHVTFSSPSRLPGSEQQGDFAPGGSRRQTENSIHADFGESRMVTVALEGGTPPSSSASRPSEDSPADSSARIGGGDGGGEEVNGIAREEAPAADENLMVEEFFQDMHANVTENLSRLQRVNLADGWDVGTTPDDMSDDLMLGLRDGFCGALSSFSSWNSAMVGLMRSDRIGDAFVGYMLGIQLPIIAYRFGQHVAVFVFIWRCRFETRRDERRGYGIRLSMNEVSERDSDDEEDGRNGHSDGQATDHEEASERKIPSVRAVATALFVLALVTQCTSLSFFNDPEKQQIALSLLFSPLGVLARWRLSRLNQWRPTFPLGTFTSNIVACLLSGSLGQLLAGNPGPRERIVLVSIISGFGGTLSSLAAFIVEVLAGIDPVLFRFDGFFYACSSVFWAWLVGFLFSATADWADQTTQE